MRQHHNKLWQPGGVYLLSFISLWDRFSFYGVGALLVSYTTQTFAFSDHIAYQLLAFYMGIGFILPVLGGFVADRIIKYERAVLLGIIGVIAGNLILIFPYLSTLYIGLAVLLCGSGLLSPNVASMLGNLYHKRDFRSAGGFTILFMMLRFGVLLGPIAYLIAHVSLSYWLGFVISALGMLAALLNYLLYLHQGFLIQAPEVLRKSVWHITVKQLFYVCLAIFMLLLVVLMLIPQITTSFIVVMLVLAIITALLLATRKLNVLERKRVIGILALGFIAAFSFACSFHVGRSLSLLTIGPVDSELWSQIMPMICSMLQPLSVVLLAPLMVAVWSYLGSSGKEPKVVVKLLLGIICVALSFIVFFMYVNLHLGNRLVWVAGGNLLLGAAELFIVPSVLVAISRLAPEKFLGTLMGVWFMLIGFTRYIAAFIADVGNSAFLATGGSVFLSFVILLLFASWLKKMLAEDKIQDKAVELVDNKLGYMHSFYICEGHQDDDSISYDYSDENHE